MIDNYLRNVSEEIPGEGATNHGLSLGIPQLSQHLLSGEIGNQISQRERHDGYRVSGGN